MPLADEKLRDSSTHLKRSREDNCSNEGDTGQEDSGVPGGNLSSSAASISSKKQKLGEVKQLPTKHISPTYPKNMSVAVLKGSRDKVVRVESLRGNYWKTMGHTGHGGINLLYLEEALYLAEKQQLIIRNDTAACCGDAENNVIDGDRDGIFSIRQFYEHVVQSISLECYLTFIKLKNLDYVVHRSKWSDVRSFGEEVDVIEAFRQHLQEYRQRHHIEICRNEKLEEPNLLSFMSSFDIYLVGDNYTKRNAAAGINTPVAHVIVTSCPKLYSSKMMLTLLRQSKQTPCLFAIVMPHSGFVVLEEMSDAEQSLSWDFGTMNSNIKKTVESTVMTLDAVDSITAGRNDCEHNITDGDDNNNENDNNNDNSYDDGNKMEVENTEDECDKENDIVVNEDRCDEVGEASSS